MVPFPLSAELKGTDSPLLFIYVCIISIVMEQDSSEMYMNLKKGCRKQSGSNQKNITNHVPNFSCLVLGFIKVFTKQSEASTAAKRENL